MTKPSDANPTVNPFESPLNTEPLIALLHDGDPFDQRGRGPVAMFFIGAIMGGVVAAIAGAVGAAMLGAILGIFGPTMEIGLGLAIIGGIIGAFMGVCSGMPFGAILGVAYGFCSARSRRWLTLATVAVSTLIGGGVGLMGGQMVADLRTHGVFSTIIGILSGCVAGAVGGWLLARLLESICWGRAITDRRATA